MSTLYRTIVSLVVCVLLAGLAAAVPPVGALSLAQRSLALGTSEADVTTDHTFSFTYPSENIVGSVVFEYCDSPLPELPCSAPNGVDVSAAVLDSQSGEAGFSIFDASFNRLVIARPAIQTALTPAVYRFTNVVNPSSTEEFFVRISTHASTDGTGPVIDFGAVVNAVTPGVNISTEVPPYLEFCVGLTIDESCESAAGDTISLGTLDPTETRRGSSQMLAATNAAFGLAITMQGRTLTAGNHTIAPLATPSPSRPGSTQFGLNLRANTDPFVGEEPSGQGVAIPAPDYNTPNLFTFRNEDVVASSPDATDVRRFTVSYIANVSKQQLPGAYSATITFMCTATF